MVKPVVFLKIYFVLLGSNCIAGIEVVRRVSHVVASDVG
jgi:hypothetical protein